MNVRLSYFNSVLRGNSRIEFGQIRNELVKLNLSRLGDFGSVGLVRVGGTGRVGFSGACSRLVSWLLCLARRQDSVKWLPPKKKNFHRNC